MASKAGAVRREHLPLWLHLRRSRDEASQRKREQKRLSRAFRLLLLLLIVSLGLLSTTLLNRASQVFLLKVFLVLFLSVLPGWLYLQFIRVKGTGLYDEYVLNLYRLNIDDVSNLPKPPPGSPQWDEWIKATKNRGLGTRSVSKNVYLAKFEAVYGKSTVPESRRKRHRDDNEPLDPREKLSERIQTDAFSPVVMMTALLCVGWTIVVQPELYRALSIVGTSTGLPELPVEPLRFGFLGAYAFILHGLVRRYFQIDLKNHAYISAMLRVIFVAAIVVALDPIWEMQKWSPETQTATAFVIGFFPELGFRVIQQRISGLRKKRSMLEAAHPLKELDGLNIWAQARLLEEGVEDMQNLTTANLVDLMLNTRMPIGRLVDWIDQSFLYLRVGGDDDRGDRAKLRKIGIRTATDLLDAFDAPETKDPEFTQRLLRVLNRKDGQDDGEASATEGIRRSLEGEVNLWHLRQWKRRSWLEEPCR